MAVAFLAGAFLVWVSELGRRRRARQAEQAVAVLEEQVKALKAQLARPGTAGG
jgi:type II secretory pathway pseudopilin PulG